MHSFWPSFEPSLILKSYIRQVILNNLSRYHNEIKKNVGSLDKSLVAVSEFFLISKNNLPRNKKKLYWSNHLHSLLINFPPYLPNYLFACLSIFIVHNNFFIINYDDYYSLLWLFEDNFKKFNQSKYRIKLLNLSLQLDV